MCAAFTFGKHLKAAKHAIYKVYADLGMYAKDSSQRNNTNKKQKKKNNSKNQMNEVNNTAWCVQVYSTGTPDSS